MRVYSFLRAVAKSIMPSEAVEKRIEAPDTYQGGLAYGFDTLAIRYIQQSGGTGVEQVVVDSVIMCYLDDTITDIDEWLTDTLGKLGYPQLQNLLNTYNEIVAVSVEKVVAYGLNTFRRHCVAIHLSIITNL